MTNLREELKMDYLVVLIRIATIIPLLLVVTLLMGKRLVGELQVFDFLIAITLGAVVGADIADPTIHHGPTAFAILLLATAQWGLSKANIRFRFFGHLTTFEPTLVIQNGTILEKNLKQIRYSLDTLLELLREKSVFRVNEVEFAVIEANGKLSVLKKSQYQPLTPSANDIPTGYYGLSHAVIVEGVIDEKKLAELNLDRNWLLHELKKQNIESPEKIFLAELDTTGHLYLSPYHAKAHQNKLRH
jgi:uncharacterized membrane protein YcaP (DUF421 family)